MQSYIVPFIVLIITEISTLFLYIIIDKMKTQKQLKCSFCFIFICLLICFTGLLLQIAFSNCLKLANPIYFDYFVYIGTCFLPVCFLLMSIIFSNTKVHFSKRYFILFIIPILSLLILWTNDLHHLFYKQYSININNSVYGPWFYIHSLYSYLCMFLGVVFLMRYSIKNAGFFSRQSLLIIIGVSIPLIINILGSLQVISMTIYVTPITFAITIFFISLAIFKFDFLKVAPIALQRIVDRISDAYIVIDENNKIADFNQTFLDIFHAVPNDVRNKNLFELVENHKNLNINLNNLKKALAEVNSSNIFI